MKFNIFFTLKRQQWNWNMVWPRKVVRTLLKQSIWHSSTIWYCWRRSQHSDVELNALYFVYKQNRCRRDAVHDTALVNMSEDFDRKDDLQFFALPYLLEPEYTNYKLREMDVLHQNADSCVICTTCVSKIDIEENKLLNKVIIFVFFAHSILIAS